MLAVFAVPTFAAKAKIGEKAPDFTLTDINGNTHSLSDFAGKTVVLEWVNPECPFVKKHYNSGNLPSMQKAASEEGTVWLAINSGSPGAQGDFDPAEAKSWMSKTGAAPTAYFRDQNGEVGRLYGAKTTPHMYVVNPQGKLIYNGAIDSIRSANARDIGKAKNYVAAALKAIQSGKMPDHQSTQPYGCSVKY
ncbi:MAG: thioredoxin family protein [Synoicihabitans sp.]